MRRLSRKKIGAGEWSSAFGRICGENRSAYSALYGRKKKQSYLCPPSHWAAMGDRRLLRLEYDRSHQSLALCSLIESQSERLRSRAAYGVKMIFAMKDLSAIPVMLAGVPHKAACIYADFAYMQPCLCESFDFLEKARDAAVPDDLCDVRAVIGAIADEDYWPRPDLCVAGLGACCDDFSAVAQRIESLGFKTAYWELPFVGDAPSRQDEIFLAGELRRIKRRIEMVIGEALTPADVRRGVRQANEIRSLVRDIRRMSYSIDRAPLPAMETLLAEAIAVDFAADPQAAAILLGRVRSLCQKRICDCDDRIDKNAIRLAVVTPSMDILFLNVLENLGARVAGSEYMIGHAFAEIDEDGDPIEALARTAALNPMIGSCVRRAELAAEEAIRFQAEGIVMLSFFGASHCAYENALTSKELSKLTGLKVLTLNAQSSCVELSASLMSRLESFIETLRRGRSARRTAIKSGCGGKHRIE